MQWPFGQRKSGKIYTEASTPESYIILSALLLQPRPQEAAGELGCPICRHSMTNVMSVFLVCARQMQAENEVSNAFSMVRKQTVDKTAGYLCMIHRFVIVLSQVLQDAV